MDDESTQEEREQNARERARAEARGEAALATYQGIRIGARGAELTTIGEVYQYARALQASGLCPAGVDTVEKATVVIQAGLELGFSPMQALRNIYPVNGRTTVWGDAVPALAQRDPEYKSLREWWQLGDEVVAWPPDDLGEDTPDNFGAYCEVATKTGGTIVRRYTIADAKRAKLWLGMGIEKDWAREKSPWVRYPQRMLQIRARTFAIRDALPGAIQGFPVAEDFIDHDEPREVLATVVDGEEVAMPRNKVEAQLEDLEVDPDCGAPELKAERQKLTVEDAKRIFEERMAEKEAAREDAEGRRIQRMALAMETEEERVERQRRKEPQPGEPMHPDKVDQAEAEAAAKGLDWEDPKNAPLLLGHDPKTAVAFTEANMAALSTVPDPEKGCEAKDAALEPELRALREEAKAELAAQDLERLWDLTHEAIDEQGITAADLARIHEENGWPGPGKALTFAQLSRLYEILVSGAWIEED